MSGTAPAIGMISFEGYVRTHGNDLIRLAWLITRNWEDARDAAQEALVGVYPHWEAVAEGNLPAYVQRSVVNAALGVIRRSRSQPVAEPESLPLAPVAVDHAAQIADSDEAWALCGELPAVQRAAVVLRFYQDHTYADIGEILGCAEATARSHVHRALARMRRRLGDDHD